MFTSAFCLALSIRSAAKTSKPRSRPGSTSFSRRMASVRIPNSAGAGGLLPEGWTGDVWLPKLEFLRSRALAGFRRRRRTDCDPPHFCFGAPGPSVHDGGRRAIKLVGPLEDAEPNTIPSG